MGHYKNAKEGQIHCKGAANILDSTRNEAYSTFARPLQKL
jgi:hypothetical protein